MRIVLDSMGSDTHPDPEVEAAVEAAALWEDTIILTGPKDILQSKLNAYDTPTSRIQIEHAPEVLEMTDKPAEAARGKALNSMAVGMELLKDDKADAFVTAGRLTKTGNVLALCRSIGIGRDHADLGGELGKHGENHHALFGQGDAKPVRIDEAESLGIELDGGFQVSDPHG